jgi:hypothetical protein
MVPPANRQLTLRVKTSGFIANQGLIPVEMMQRFSTRDFTS